MVPYKFFEKPPYEFWRKRESNLKYLKRWGCLANVNIPVNKKRKIGPKIVGYVFTLAGGVVSWKFAKQTIISHSIMEAKIIALDAATSETKFLKNLLCDLPLLNKSILLILMHCDSQVVISRVTSKDFNEKKRHLRVRHKSIRNLISHGFISFDFVKS